MEGILSGSDERSGQARDSLYVHNGEIYVYEDAFWVERGICNLSEVNDIQLDGTHRYAATYMDDLVVFSGSWEENLQHVDEILQWIERGNLTLRAEKCNIGAVRCIFLGHEVGWGHVDPVQAKIEAVQQFNRPITKKDVRSFLGLTRYYRKFIKDYATIAIPLTNLLKKSLPGRVSWNEETDRTFEQLKQVIMDKAVLRTADLTKDFILQTDALGRGIGAVLTQNFEDGERSLAFFSKKLLPAQTRSPATEIEGLAVVKAIQQFEFYLYGCPFKVQTDHMMLKKVKIMTNTKGRLLRLAMPLQSYDFTVEHKPWADNSNANGVSCQAEDGPSFEVREVVRIQTHV